MGHSRPKQTPLRPISNFACVRFLRKYTKVFFNGQTTTGGGGLLYRSRKKKIMYPKQWHEPSNYRRGVVVFQS